MDASVEVPFVMVGNRQCLTAEQLHEHDWLREFFERFSDCFERDTFANVWWFSPSSPTVGDR